MVKKIVSMNLTDKLKSGWTMLKFIRVGLGSLILYSSIESGQVFGIVVGSLFTIVSLLSDGVCSAGGSCYTVPGKNNPSSIETIEYEELDIK